MLYFRTIYAMRCKMALLVLCIIYLYYMHVGWVIASCPNDETQLNLPSFQNVKQPIQLLLININLIRSEVKSEVSERCPRGTWIVLLHIHSINRELNTIGNVIELVTVPQDRHLPDHLPYILSESQTCALKFCSFCCRDERILYAGGALYVIHSHTISVCFVQWIYGTKYHIMHLVSSSRFY